jgi:hypothetical protein
MKPFSHISRMLSSLVAPHTPAWVVTRSPSSRAASNAPRSGNAGSAVTSNASCRLCMSSVGVRATNERKSALLVHSQGAPSRLPYASTDRPGAPRSASSAASPCAIVCSPCDQSTVVVTPASTASMAASRLPAAMSSGRKILPQLR